MKIIIIGGVAVGASFATRMRRLNEKHEIIIYEKSSFISYANCGLPYNLSGKITRDKLEVTNPKELHDKFNIKVNVNSEVININLKNKQITIKNTKTNKEVNDTYDKLILGTGTRAFLLPIPGLDKEQSVFTLKNLDDLDKVMNHIDKTNPKKAVIFGGGFIGLEVAESLIEAKWDVSVIDVADSLIKMDKDMSILVEEELVSNGVKLYLKAFTDKVDPNKKQIILKDGRIIKYDLIFATAGIKPNTEFIKKAGIKVDDRGIVLINDNMLTSDSNIYAAGDIVYTTHRVTNKKVYSPLAWGANRQARVIANHLAGIPDKQPNTLNTAIIKIFRKSAAQTGLTEFAAKLEGYTVGKSFVDLNHHAGYYPGAKKIQLKLVYDVKTGKVLGAQAVGEGADKKIDIIATALYAKLTIYDLLDLNLAYAPPYGSAKDVINLAAAVAINKIQRKFKDIYGYELKKNIFLIDVRPKTVYEIGTIKGAINIPNEELRKTKKLPTDKNKEIYVICNSGLQSYNGLSVLQGMGYKNLVNIAGGFHHYSAYTKMINYQPKESAIINATKSKEIKMEKSNSKKQVTGNGKSYDLDCTGLACPGPLLKLHKKLKEINDGDTLNVVASDFGFADDLKTWVVKNNHTLLNVESNDDGVRAIVVKGLSGSVTSDTRALASVMTQGKKRATIVLFSGSYDKSIAAFIIAQAAASLGTQVTIFATFWGLSALRIKSKVKLKKTYMEKRFAKMLPLGSNEMKLSSMNMGGIGKKIIKSTMKKHNVKSPDEMLKDAMDMGVEMIACTMSMDLLGLKKEEIVKGASFAGAAKYVSHADDSNLTLFI